MKHILFTAPIATGLLLFAGAGIAQAVEVTTSNDAHGDTVSYEGTSNDTQDPNITHGHVTADTPTHVWQVIRVVAVLDDEGNPVYDDQGDPVTENVWGWVPVGDGINSIVIFHP